MSKIKVINILLTKIQKSLLILYRTGNDRFVTCDKDLKLVEYVKKRS